MPLFAVGVEFDQLLDSSVSQGIGNPIYRTYVENYYV